MPDPTPTPPLWKRTSAEEGFSAPLLPGAETDVAIVGGGYTGLSTALHGAERGLACHVLEARELGHGGSGRNAGMLNPGMWLPPQDVVDRLGEEAGRRAVELFGNAPAYVMDLVERHQIRCELTRTGSIHAAHSRAGFEGLRRRAEGWKRFGAPARIVEDDEMAELVGTRAFRGGLLDARAGSINPMGYLRGLARAARDAGAAVSTGARATGLRRDGGGWIVETPEGELRAKRVVLATNAYTDALWPGLDRTIAGIHYLQVATEPLGERVREILPGRQPLWTADRLMISVRRDMSDRLILGTMGTVVRGVSERFARRTLAKLFPDLGSVRLEEAWHGRIAMTPDGLPRIHRLADGLHAAIGYNGRGITTGTVLGRALADLLAGGREEDLPFRVAEPAPYPWRRLKQAFYQAAFTAHQVRGSLL